MARSRRTAVSALSAAVILGAGLAIAGPPTVATAGRLITGGEVKNGSLTGKDIRNGSVTSADLAPGARNGAVGPQGPKGDPGTAGGSDTTTVDWTYEHTAGSGQTQVETSSVDKIPAGTVVQVIAEEFSLRNDPKFCRANLRLGDAFLGNTATAPEAVVTEATPLSLHTYCGMGAQEEVPSFSYTVTLSLTTIDLTPESTLR